MPIPAELAKNRREHRVYLTALEVALLREQLMARAPGTSLVFPTPEGRRWDRARFRDRVWVKSVAAASRHDREESGREDSVFDGFNFHWLRHTAGSLMAVAGLDPAVASERMGHTDGGALFLRTYRHLYEGEKRVQAARLEAHVRASLDKEGTNVPGTAEISLNQAVLGDGRTWDRTRLTAHATFATHRKSSRLLQGKNVRPSGRPIDFPRLSSPVRVDKVWT